MRLESPTPSTLVLLVKQYNALSSSRRFRFCPITTVSGFLLISRRISSVKARTTAAGGSGKVTLTTALLEELELELECEELAGRVSNLASISES
jgi:hypothetical protein